MDASSNMRSCFYRSGYDFAVPLRHQVGFGNITYVAPWHREYFLTVKVRKRWKGAGPAFVRKPREGERPGSYPTAVFGTCCVWNVSKHTHALIQDRVVVCRKGGSCLCFG